MGRDIIVEKLNRELTETITSERQVVYILVETRKLLELMGMREDYPQLCFFCDWAMHPTLDRVPAQRVIKLFDRPVVAQRTSPPTLADIQADPDAMQKYFGEVCSAFDLIGFGGFKAQIEAFYERQKVDCGLLQREEEWIRFLGYYSSVIEDCPLKCQGDAVYVRTLIVRKVPADSYSTESQVNLCLQWIWVHDDGTETPIINSTLVYPQSQEECEP